MHPYIIFENYFKNFEISSNPKILDNDTLSEPENSIYSRLGIYTLLGMGQAVFVCLAAILVTLGMVRASWLLHQSMLTGILRSPMAFFDVTPLGRILNRFAKVCFLKSFLLLLTN